MMLRGLGVLFGCLSPCVPRRRLLRPRIIRRDRCGSCFRSPRGGGGGVFSRALADELQKAWHQPVIVENRPGGGQNIGARACAEATPTATPSA